MSNGDHGSGARSSLCSHRLTDIALSAPLSLEAREPMDRHTAAVFLAESAIESNRIRDTFLVGTGFLEGFFGMA